MGKRFSLGVAAALVVVPASTGLGMVSSHAAEAAEGVRQTTGGCWTYHPDASGSSADTPRWQLPVLSDVTIGEVDAWSSRTEGALLTLSTQGATVQDGQRDFTLGVEDGPVLRSASATPGARAGTATALLSVVPLVNEEAAVDEALTITAESEFLATAGQPVGDLVFEGTFPLEAGSFELRLDSLYFADEGGSGVVTVCNGQVQAGDSTDVVDGVPGANPATAPLSTSAVSEFSARDASIYKLGAVQGQQPAVTTAARPGDVLDMEVGGLDSNTEFGVDLVVGGNTFSLVDGNGASVFPVDAAGAGAVLLEVPQGVSTGQGELRILSGPGEAKALALTILATPEATTVEEVGDKGLEVTVVGLNWDPKASVTVEPMAAGVPSEDRAASAVIGDVGELFTTLTLTDTETDGLRVTQERPDGFAALSTDYTLTNEVPVVPGAPTPPTPQGPPANQPAPPSTQPSPPATQPVPPSAVAPVPPLAAPVVPPVEVPLPEGLPIEDIDAPVAAEPGEEVLSISEATLAGETSLGELFGGPSRRDVRILVENSGETLVSNPLVRLGVGRDGDAQPGLVAAEVGDLQPGARVLVSVDVALPMASFGTYQVVGQVGESDANRFQLRWDTYPWGLIGLNLAGVALLAWGVARRRNAIAPTPLASADGEDEGASVIDLGALDDWWVRGKVSSRLPQAVHLQDDDSDSVVDLEAADRWWAKRDSKVS